MKKLLKTTFLFSTMGLIYDYNTREQVAIRNLRTVWCGMKLLYNYKIRFSEDNFNEIHETTARDIYELCKTNDGLYVKFG